MEGNRIYRIAFTLQLEPGQDIASYFETSINNDNNPTDYQFSGAFGAKTFQETYNTVQEAQDGINLAFQPLTNFVRDLTAVTSMQNPPKAETTTYNLIFPNTGGDLTGTVRCIHDTGMADISQILFVLDGASITVKRQNIKAALEVIAEMVGFKEILLRHAQLDL